MKNIQIIDGAKNCAYSIYHVDDKTFHKIFCEKGQDIEFIDDLIHRLGEHEAGELLRPIWENRIEKQKAHGIHGTLFFELDFKKTFYPNKREIDLDNPIKGLDLHNDTFS